MSLVQDLADQIRIARDELPIAEVTAAAERLRMAGGLLAWVMHATSDPARVPQLGGATELLESAVGLMRSAQDSLGEYTAALGIAADSVPPANAWAAAVPLQRADGGRQLADWWSERVQMLADTPVGDLSEPADTSTELLRRCAAAALDDHPGRLHRELSGSGAAVGLGLAAVAPPLLRFLAADLVGHPPRLEDLARVRRAALSFLGMLPKLPAEAAEEIVARVCHATPQRRTDSGPVHPVDSAAAAALLVAGLLRATGRGAAELHAVVEEEQRRRSALAEAHAKRTALRVGDGGRRRSAVDALAGGSDAPAGG